MLSKISVQSRISYSATLCQNLQPPRTRDITYHSSGGRCITSPHLQESSHRASVLLARQKNKERLKKENNSTVGWESRFIGLAKQRACYCSFFKNFSKQGKTAARYFPNKIFLANMIRFVDGNGRRRKRKKKEASKKQQNSFLPEDIDDKANPCRKKWNKRNVSHEQLFYFRDVHPGNFFCCFFVSWSFFCLFSRLYEDRMPFLFVLLLVVHIFDWCVDL